MAKDQCEHLFRLYLRNRHNQRLTGIGLGCYQSRQIVEAHGGHIGVTSSPGQGSHFWFTLPLAV
ncbi:sensor histidine kinase [Synechocystis sp. B12]|nr:sensor histidine kinase [Synechocystis sp. B12]